MFSKDEIRKLLQMPDEQLQEKIRAAAKVSGADMGKVIKSSGDIGKLKSILSQMSQEDITKILANVDSDKLKALAEELKNDNK